MTTPETETKPKPDIAAPMQAPGQKPHHKPAVHHTQVVTKAAQANLEILHEEAARVHASEGTVEFLSHLMRGVESDGSNYAKNIVYDKNGHVVSTAYGPFQITTTTGIGYGLNASNRFDPHANCHAALMLTNDNARALTPALGCAPGAGDLYMAHFAGSAGAVHALMKPSDRIATYFLASAMLGNAKLEFNGVAFANWTGKELRGWAHQQMHERITARKVFQAKVDKGFIPSPEEMNEDRNERVEIMKDMGVPEDQAKGFAGTWIGKLWFALLKLLGFDDTPDVGPKAPAQQVNQNTVEVPKIKSITGTKQAAVVMTH